MTPINFIGLGFSNPLWDNLCDYFLKTYSDYIDRIKCMENGLTSYTEKELHCTLMYNESYQYGKNFTEVHLRYGDKTKNAFNKLLSTKELTVPELVVDTFKNNDSIVLKINLNKCNMFGELELISEYFNSLAINPSEYKQYNPHFTITYLNATTEDEVIDKMVNDIQTKYGEQLNKFQLATLMLSNRDEMESAIIPLYD